MPFMWITIQNKRANHLELPLFLSAVETEILNLSKTKPLEWKRFIDDIFSLWITERKEIAEFITLPGITLHLNLRLKFLYPGYQRFFSRAVGIVGEDFTETGNRTRKVSGTQGKISDKEINFLDTTVYKGERFHNHGILDILGRSP